MVNICEPWLKNRPRKVHSIGYPITQMPISLNSCLSPSASVSLTTLSPSINQSAPPRPEQQVIEPLFFTFLHAIEIVFKSTFLPNPISSAIRPFPA